MSRWRRITFREVPRVTNRYLEVPIAELEDYLREVLDDVQRMRFHLLQQMDPERLSREEWLQRARVEAVDAAD